MKPPNVRKSHGNAELLFEEPRFAAQLAKIDVGFRAGGNADENRPALNLDVHTAGELRFSRIQRHRDTQQRGQLPNTRAVRFRERTIEAVVKIGHGLAMVAHQAGHHALLVLAESGDIGMAHKIFAVLVLRARIYRDAHVVQQRT